MAGLLHELFERHDRDIFQSAAQPNRDAATGGEEGGETVMK